MTTPVGYLLRLDTPATVFERQCGPCHRVLSPAGLFGTGTTGLDLSGLFAAF